MEQSLRLQLRQSVISMSKFIEDIVENDRLALEPLRSKVSALRSEVQNLERQVSEIPMELRETLLVEDLERVVSLQKGNKDAEDDNKGTNGEQFTEKRMNLRVRGIIKRVIQTQSMSENKSKLR